MSQHVSAMATATSTGTDWWLQPILKHLGALATRLHTDLPAIFDEGVDRYGSDCTGADAPYHAMREMQAYFAGKGIDWRLRNEFGSEDPTRNGDAARKFLALNDPPNILFDDMTERGSHGKDHYSKRVVRTPVGLQWYVSGFCCVDQSSENRYKKPLQLNATSDSGASTRTWCATRKYIEFARPDRFILENVYRKQTLKVIRAWLETLEDYFVVMFFINSKVSGAPSSRPRLYIVGINLKTCRPRIDPCTWAEELSKIFASSYAQRRAWETYIQPVDSASVEACWLELGSKHRPKNKWEKQHKKHMMVRDALKKHYSLHLPDPDALPPLPDGTPNDWLDRLPRRMRDLIFLHTAVSYHILNVSPKECKLSWDASHGAQYPEKKDPSCGGQVPCFTTAHYIWNANAGRVYTGLEQMDMQGFNTKKMVLAGPRHPTRSASSASSADLHISDAELRHLSGNTITVH